MAHIADGSDLFCSNFGFMTFLQLLGQWHILQMGVIFFNFGFMTFLQLLGQWHILQMGVIYFFQFCIYDIFAIAGQWHILQMGVIYFVLILDL